jgi:hypothetical protein
MLEDRGRGLICTQGKPFKVTRATSKGVHMKLRRIVVALFAFVVLAGSVVPAEAARHHRHRHHHRR